GSMSVLPFLGHAVQAPILIAPNAVPRVSASHVAPSPTAAPTKTPKKEPRTNRPDELTSGADQWPRTTEQRLALTASDAGLGTPHDVVPRHRRQRSAGHALGRRVVVVADPDAADVIAGEPDEPGVAVGVGGAGLAGRLDPVEDRAPSGAFLHHLVHDDVHFE